LDALPGVDSEGLVLTRVKSNNRKSAGGLAPRSPPKPSRFAPPFGPVLMAWVKIGVLPLAAGVYALITTYPATEELFFWRQDLPVFGLCLALVAVLGLVRIGGLARLRALLARAPAAWALALGAFCLAVGLFGARHVFEGYQLSLDEFMADFDAQIFAHGQLMAPIVQGWSDFSQALQPLYVLPVAKHGLWASSYLPINAAFRALALRAHLEPWVNPLWSGLAVVAVYGVARRLWPERPGMALGAAALLASSAQLLVMSMTDYAMPAHLALNLVWLWLFLRGGRLGHAGAIVVAFLASGLHQVVFHPLFAAPFLLQLWLDRRWRLASVYTIAYAAIGLFWIFYWSLLMRVVGAPPEAATALGGGWFVARIIDILRAVRLDNLGSMAESLVRFVTWQNPLTAPLALIGALAAERAKGVPRALVLGVLLTLVGMLLLEPSQTHGWGYRYLHGLLGSVCLLAMWTWSRLTDPLPAAAKARAETAFVAACAVSLLVLTPLRAWQAWSYSHPYARAFAAIQAAPAQVVVVDFTTGVWFNVGTVVRNDPYLLQNPKVMLITQLDTPHLRRLCAAHSVLVFDGQSARDYGIDTVRVPPTAEIRQRRALMTALGCGRRMS
jgi:hypothetical protein